MIEERWIIDGGIHYIQIHTAGRLKGNEEQIIKPTEVNGQYYVCIYPINMNVVVNKDSVIRRTFTDTSIKDITMNKTVRDAVTKYKGEWPDFDGLIDGSSTAVIGYSKITYKIELLGSECDKGLYFIVCDEIEFNNYVYLLASNMGRATQTYTEYKKGFECMSTPTGMSLDELAKIKGSFDKGLVYECTVGGSANEENPVFVAGNAYQCNGKGIVDEYDKGDKTSICSSGDDSFMFKLIGPQPKPVFTQEMSDNGELPSVGMECQGYILAETIVQGNTCDKWVKGVFVQKSQSPNGGMCFLFKCDKGRYYTLNAVSHFKPLTPPIELIDGECYQFEYNKSTLKGFFKQATNRFFYINGFLHTEVCTNIKPLTVEVK